LWPVRKVAKSSVRLCTWKADYQPTNKWISDRIFIVQFSPLSPGPMTSKVSSKVTSKVFPSGKTSDETIRPAPSRPRSQIGKEQQQQGQASLRKRKDEAPFFERLQEAVYVLCPDCSKVQCLAIIIGLVATALLTLLFLWLGGYWSASHRTSAYPTAPLGATSSQGQ
jgi:hypothetical protein